MKTIERVPTSWSRICHSWVIISPKQGPRVFAYADHVHLTIQEDGTAGLWCNGTGMGVLDAEEAQTVMDVLRDV